MNLADPGSVERVFTDDKGGFDYVFNLAAETKYGQSDEVSWLGASSRRWGSTSVLHCHFSSGLSRTCL